jgi:predicted Zn-dependent protease
MVLPLKWKKNYEYCSMKGDPMKWNALILCFLLLTGCSITRPAGMGNSKYGSKAVDVIVIPLDGVPDAFIKMIAEEISNQHALNAKAATRMSLSKFMYDPNWNQYMSNRIADEAFKLSNKFQSKHDKTLLLVITNLDINAEGSHVRYNYATHFNHLSVISTARIDPKNIGEQENEQLKKTRILKLINKAIGQQVYGYATSSDIRSVMYGPITSLQDLDKMGSAFTEGEQLAQPYK